MVGKPNSLSKYAVYLRRAQKFPQSDDLLGDPPVESEECFIAYNDLSANGFSGEIWTPPTGTPRMVTDSGHRLRDLAHADESLHQMRRARHSRNVKTA